MLIDSHAHIYDELYLPNGGEKPIVEGMAADGLEYIVCVGCDIPTSTRCVELAEKYENIYATAGVHPYYPETVTPENLDILAKLAESKKVVAIGEFGLDFHREGAPRELQITAMIAQYDLARSLKLPQIYHIRDGYGEFTDFMRARDFPDGAVLHCFSSSAEVAELAVKKGFYISFSGTVTYRNAKNLHRAAERVPLDRLLVETDSPYLVPAGAETELNYPKNVALVAKKIAELKNLSYFQIEEATNRNTKAVFNLK